MPHSDRDFLKKFFETNPDFDLLRADMDRDGTISGLNFDGFDQQIAIEALKTQQRLLRIYPLRAVADTLYDAGLRSAHDIAGLPEHSFVSRHFKALDKRDGKTEGVELARRIHRRAVNIVERVRLHAMNLVSLADPAATAVLAGTSSGLLDFYSGLPGYQELFGNLNYLQCEDCQSIWSPAAYFVDLLRLVDLCITKPENEQLSLRARRPDLWQIPLTCESTQQEVPYLQIVNQILETQVRCRLEKSFLKGVKPAGARHVLKFNGNDNIISIPRDPFLVPNYSADPITYSPTDQFTICAWVNTAAVNESSGQTIVGLQDGSDSNDWKPTLYIPEWTDSLALRVGGTNGSSQVTLFQYTVENFFTSANTWVHIAWTFDLKTNQSAFYRDGVQFGPVTDITGISAIYTNVNTGYQIGKTSAGYWLGLIANVGIWQRVLEHREIISVMKAEGLPESQTGMTSYWLINDDSTTIANSATYAIANQQDFNLYGTLDGTAQWESLQVSSAESFLSQNPVVSENPLLYLATQDYPFQLPFNHPLVQVRRLLAHFNITLAEVYGAFLVGDAHGNQQASIAREALELSPEEYNLLSQPTTDDAALEQSYGLAVEGSPLSDLSDAAVFLEQTKLNDDEFNQLLFQNLKRKRALEFDGSINVPIGNPPAMQGLTGDLTIEMWIRPTDLTERRNPICKAYGGEFAITQETASGDSPAPMHFYYGESGESYNEGSANSMYQSVAIQPSFLNLNEWSHIAIARDLSNTKTIHAYVNGKELLNPPVTAQFPVAVAGDSPVLIGAGYVDPYIGQIADVRIWNVARDEDEIKADMNLRLKGDEPGLVGYWPLDDGVGTTARDLSPNKNYGTVSQVSGDELSEPPAWPFAAELVWDGNEINSEILSQFFINQGLSSGQYLSIKTVDTNGVVTRNIVVEDASGVTSTPLDDAGTFDRINRFIRLAQSLGWSFADLDLALRSIKPPPDTDIDESAIKALAALKNLKARLNLRVDELCALWSDMNTFGIGNGPIPEDLFDRTFNYPTSFADPTGAAGTPPYRPLYNSNPNYYDPLLEWNPKDRTSEPDRILRNGLRGALGLDDDDLTHLSDFVLNSQPQQDGGDSKTIYLDVENLSKFYRYATLSRSLNLRTGQFVVLLRLLKIGDVDSIKKVIDIVNWADWMQAAGLNVAQLEYLTTGKVNPWINPGYDAGAVASLLAGMFQESKSLLLTPSSFTGSKITQDDSEKIFQQLQSEGAIDENGVVLNQPVGQALGPEPLSRSVLKFDGASTYISIPDDPFVLSSGRPIEQFTICAWVNPKLIDNANYTYVCGMEDDSDENKIKPAMYMPANSDLTLRVGGFDLSDDPAYFGQDLGGFFPAAGAWVHVAWVFDLQTSTSTVYRNGEVFGAPQQISLKQIYTSDTGYGIGAWDAGGLWQGEVANFGIWQRVLDQREVISAMYAAALPDVEIGLLAYWLINDQTETGGIIKDYAGNNDGTLNGSADWETARDILTRQPDSNLRNLFIRETLIVALARQDQYVTQKLAAFFGVSPESAAAAQTLVLVTRDEPLLHINRLLIDLPPGDIVPDDVSGLIAAIALDLYLASALGLTPLDVGGISRQPAAFNLSEFSSAFEWSIENIRVISEYKKLIAASGNIVGEIIDYFSLASSTAPGFSQAAQIKLAQITGWPLDQIILLESQDFWPSGLRFDTVEQVAALKRCFDLAWALGAGIDSLLSLRRMNNFELGAPGTSPSVETWESYLAIAHALAQVVTARYGNSVAPQVMSEIEGKNEELKRDVLVAFLLWELSFTYDDMKTSDDLYDFLLIDVDMSSVVQVSRLKAGLNSLQLYVESTLMHLEAEVTNNIPRLWWRWMSNYRVWRANREVFVYPENYIDPSLRRFKTPQFKQLEAGLQQGRITPGLVESALTGYLEGLAEVANLEIVSSYRAQVKTPASEAGTDPGLDTIFLFGRTRTNPPTFYYRTLRLFDNEHVEQGVWTPWQQINVSITAEKITPIHAFDKLFIFWVEQSSKTVSVAGGGEQSGSYQITTATIYYSFQKLDRSWIQPQTLEQNLVVSVNGPYNYYPPVDPNSPIWKQVQVLINSDTGQIIILYGGFVLSAPNPPNSPTKSGNLEIDAYNFMVYESMLFAQSIEGSGYMTSIIPLWLLGGTMARDRANLKVNPSAEHCCSGMLAGVASLDYVELPIIDSPALSDVFQGFLPVNFLPLNGDITDVITGKDATLLYTPSWETVTDCPLGSSYTVLNFPATSYSYSSQELTEGVPKVSGDISFEIWVQLTSTSSAQTILQLLGPQGDGYQLKVDSGNVWASNLNLQSSTASFTASPDWMCVTVVVNAAMKKLSIYLNGEYKACTSATAGEIRSLYILGFSGYVTNYILWNEALTDEQVRVRYTYPNMNLAAAPVPLLTSGLSAFASRVESVGNQPGWFTFDNGDEAFLVVPAFPGRTSNSVNLDVFNSLEQITSITETAPTGRGVNRRTVAITFGDAAVDPSLFDISGLSLEFIRITTHVVSDLQRRFFIGGPDMMLALASQVTPELPFARFTPTDQVLAPSSRVLDFGGAYGEYFWELFFYAPFLVANTLSVNRRFQMAQKWYQYIFNPAQSFDDDIISGYASLMEYEGLISYWPLNGNANDVIGGNNGQVVIKQSPAFNDAAFVNGLVRQVFYSPDNYDNNINVNSASDLNITTAITLEGWCKLSSFGDDDSWIIQKKVDGDFENPWYAYRLSTKEGVFTFSLSINGEYASVNSGGSTAELNEWYYVAGTYDGRQLWLYVNGWPVAGLKVATLSSPPPKPPWTIATSGQPVSIGGDSFYGEMADVRIWDRALSPETISRHYRLTAGLNPEDRFWRFRPFVNHSVDSLQSDLTNSQQIAVYQYDPFDPDALARLRPGANEKGIVMRYIENLLKWGNNLFAQYTWETVTEATVLYAEALDLLGPVPRQVGDIPAPPVKTSLDFVKEYGSAAEIPQFLIQLEHRIQYSPPATSQELPALPFNLLNSYFCVPVDRMLLALWQAIDTQLYKIRHGENIKGQPQPLPLFEPPLNPAALVKAGPGSLAQRSGTPSGSPTIPYFRFTYLIDRAKDFASQVIQLGSALLGALERQDAEQLALIQNSNEAAILNLTTQIKQNQIDELEQTGLSLQAALSSAQQRKQTYASWLEGKPDSNGNSTNGNSTSSQQNSSVTASWSESLSPAEETSLVLLGEARIMHGSAALMRVMASPLFLLPDIFGLADGGMSFGGSVEAVAGALDSVGGTLGITSQLIGIVGQWQRRDQEWLLQYQLASDDVEQIQAQIEANKTALSSAQRDLQVHQEQIAQNQAIGNFYKTKFTNEQLYQWMSGRLSTIYFQGYQLAFDLAQEAQVAFQYENNSQKNYLNYGAWDSVEKGLTAGDALMLSLDQLQKAYIDTGVRHLEIEKTISLLQIDPQAVITLKTKGKCSFALTERLFDYDFPGHYNRKITSVSITIPAIVGPYQNVHATLTQASNRVVLQPDINAVTYLLTGRERDVPPPLSIRSNWNVKQQVALSRGTDDSGLFVLDFNDPRYLPFEGTGAISTWTLEMPQAANAIDFNSISDVIIKLSYTAQDGGETFRKEVTQQPSIQNYSGFRFLSLRQSFPEAWHNFMHPTSGNPTMQFPILRAMFPVNLEPKSVTLGAESQGMISVQCLLAEGGKSDVPDLSLNGQSVANGLVQLVVPGQGVTDAPIYLSDFGITKPNTLAASQSISRHVVDVIMIIPFNGELNWSSTSS
jgi:hypothetical protein